RLGSVKLQFKIVETLVGFRDCILDIPFEGAGLQEQCQPPRSQFDRLRELAERFIELLERLASFAELPAMRSQLAADGRAIAARLQAAQVCQPGAVPAGVDLADPARESRRACLAGAVAPEAQFDRVANAEAA